MSRRKNEEIVKEVPKKKLRITSDTDSSEDLALPYTTTEFLRNVTFDDKFV